jgi:hypothetical protein
MKTKKQMASKMPKLSPSDLSLKRKFRPEIKHAKKVGKRVCQTCGSSIAHQEKGEDTCDNCAK